MIYRPCDHGIDLNRERCVTCELHANRRDAAIVRELKRNAKTLRAARAALAPELNRPIIGAVADRIIEELKGTDGN
jgi:hypothetical protein